MNRPVDIDQQPASDAWVALLLLAAMAMLAITTPRDGAFWWSDAPRHALNGVFIRDLILDFPWRDPAAYAYNYYAQHPALTILFYPPLFYVLSAPLFALFGATHEVALMAVFLHYAAFSWGAYRLAQLWFPVKTAAALALCLVLMPEIAFWGRQVMLELPAYAFLVWSAVHFVRHLRSGATRSLVWAVVLLLAAMYTKISVAFLVPILGLVLWRRHGAVVWRQARTWWIVTGALIATLPLLALTLKFGQANVQSVSNIADSVASRTTLSGWIWYAKQWPGQLGAPLSLFLAGLALAGFLRLRKMPQRSSVAEPGERLFLLCWLLLGYIYFSLIDLKEARHSVYLLMPLLLLIFVRLSDLGWADRNVTICAWLAVILAGISTFAYRPVHYVDGYASAARWLVKHAPAQSTVLFSGYRDGSFIFNLRAADPDRQLHVLRADKLLLRVAVRRELGVEQKATTDQELMALLNSQAVHYLVVQPGFWNDLDVMRRFEAMLIANPQFELVHEFPTSANYQSAETKLLVWRNKAAATKRQGGQVIELPIIGRTIKQE
jgi:hypothetical protein